MSPALRRHALWLTGHLSLPTYHLVRLTAPVASDAAPVLPGQHGTSGRRRVTLEQAQGVMVAISPIVGSARIASAAVKILRACGVADAIEEAEEG